MELLTTHQQLREAFSNSEVTEAKKKKSLLEDFNTVSDVECNQWSRYEAASCKACHYSLQLVFPSIAHRTDMEADAMD